MLLLTHKNLKIEFDNLIYHPIFAFLFGKFIHTKSSLPDSIKVVRRFLVPFV